MLIRNIIKVTLCAMLCTPLLSADDLNIDNLLNNIEKKTDLSEKTKLANGGISYIYTREDLRKMQAHNLKDVLKSTYPFGYNENNFGLSDPYAIPASLPFMSSSLKIYIDNQEISTGLYGSGMLIYGDMDIDFVDHIEVYTGNPTLEYSTEPAFTIIKLYSRVAQKDEGSQISIMGGSRGTKAVNGFTTSELDNGWSYFTYASYTDEKRKKYHNENATLSKDAKTTHLFGTFYNENHHIMLDMGKREKDTFMAQSIFATPKDSNLENKYLHLGYDGKLGNFSLLATLDKNEDKSYFQDLQKGTIDAQMAGLQLALTNPALTPVQIATYTGQLTSLAKIPTKVETDSTSEVYTLGLKYNIHTETNKFVAGIKYRYKHFIYDTLKFNEQELPRTGHTHQITSTAFMENQYYLAQNKIITAGIAYSKVTNNNSPQNDDLISARLGYTYTNKNWIFKTTASHLEVSLDPYLINSIYLKDPTKRVDTAKQNIFMQDVIYEKGTDKYELILSYILVKDQLMPDMSTGLLDAYDKTLDIKSSLVRYTKEYRDNDKVEFSAGYNQIKNLPQTDLLKQYSATIRNCNTIGKFDIFNELLYYRDNQNNKDFYDYSAGIIYHYSADVTFSLKGTNLLDKAKQSLYGKVDSTTYRYDPLHISPIDKKVLVSMQWVF